MNEDDRRPGYGFRELGFRDYGIERVVESSSFVSGHKLSLSFTAAEFFVETLIDRAFARKGIDGGWRVSQPVRIHTDTMFEWYTGTDGEIPSSQEIPSFVADDIALRRRLYNDRIRHSETWVGTTFNTESDTFWHKCFIRCVCFDWTEVANLLGVTLDDDLHTLAEVKIWSCGCNNSQEKVGILVRALISVNSHFAVKRVFDKLDRS